VSEQVQELAEIPECIQGPDRRLLERIRVEAPWLFGVALQTRLNQEPKIYRVKATELKQVTQDGPEEWWDK